MLPTTQTLSVSRGSFLAVGDKIIAFLFILIFSLSCVCVLGESCLWLFGGYAAILASTFGTLSGYNKWIMKRDFVLTKASQPYLPFGFLFAFLGLHLITAIHFPATLPVATTSPNRDLSSTSNLFVGDRVYFEFEVPLNCFSSSVHWKGDGLPDWLAWNRESLVLSGFANTTGFWSGYIHARCNFGLAEARSLDVDYSLPEHKDWFHRLLVYELLVIFVGLFVIWMSSDRIKSG